MLQALVGIAFIFCVYGIYRLPSFNKPQHARSDILQNLDDELINTGDDDNTAVDTDDFSTSLKSKNLVSLDIRVDKEQLPVINNQINFKTKTDKLSEQVTHLDKSVNEINVNSISDANKNINSNLNVTLKLETKDKRNNENHNAGDKAKSQTNSIRDESGMTRQTSDSEYELGDFIFTHNDEEFDLSSIARHQKEDEEIFKTFSNFQNQTNYLIYYCDTKCGGLADRLKGITMVYIMSLLSKRKFAIDMKKPCELEHFLEPNLLDWKGPSKAEITGKPVVILDYFEYYDAFKIEFMKNDLDPATTVAHKYVRMKSNQDWTRIYRTLSVAHERFPQLYIYHSSDLLRIIYNGLFKPSPELHKLVENFMKDNVAGSKLACLHARMGEEEYIRYTMRQITTPLKFLKQFDDRDDYKILVATDNHDVKKLSKNMFKNFVDTSGPIKHIDFMLNGSMSEEQKCSGFMRTMVDHMILRRCDNLVLTESGFGVSAASLRHTSRGLYVYKKNDKVLPTKRSLLREVFQWRCVWHWWGSGRYDYYSGICDS